MLPCSLQGPASTSSPAAIRCGWLPLSSPDIKSICRHHKLLPFVAPPNPWFEGSLLYYHHCRRLVSHGQHAFGSFLQLLMLSLSRAEIIRKLHTKRDTRGERLTYCRLSLVSFTLVSYGNTLAKPYIRFGKTVASGLETPPFVVTLAITVS